MRERLRAWLAAVAAVGGLAVPNMALAGPLEELISIALHPKDPKVLAVRYQNGGGGIIYSADAGQTWQLMCASMIAPGEDAEGPLRLTSDGRTLIGVFAGMWQGASGGCEWGKAAELEGVRISDLTGHPSDPDIAFAITGNGEPAMNDIRRRDANGTWSAVGAKDVAIFSRLRIAKLGDELRFYESGQRGVLMVGTSGAQAPNYLIRYSDDGGMNWTEHPLEVPMPAGTMRLEAVDPEQPDRIVVSIHRTTADDTILVSTDRGETFSEYLTLTDLGGIALAPDGRIWIGDYGNAASTTAPRGLWFAESLDVPPTKITGDYQVACLAYQAATDTLYACRRVGLSSVGSVDQKTGSFTQLFGIETATEFVSCGNTAAAVCKVQLCNAYCGPMHFATAPLCTAYDEPTCGPDADGPGPMSAGMLPTGGVAGATASGAAPPAPPPVNTGSKGGCATTAPGQLVGPAGQMACIGLCAMALWRRYRRRETRFLA